MSQTNENANAQLLTRDEVANILRCSKTFLYLHRDKIPRVKLGRKVLYDRSVIDELVKSFPK
ncbi:helix-turn-helix transcriptional regulator [Parafilimonas terrae]|uniref:DNA binding domain-containing protein, excisionase family n=1 Tax=Parafilimonas terrae TaxID=1465490 RepID=A0A1I5UAM7_9BACT|nr:helix-turn-helix domain-containing protein [Parafilimonas terrae]SFP92310.1 DNA binding domain-containing protein, excisionase family [Parafilimonas terrae]